MVYIALNKDFVDKNLEKMHKEAIEELGEEEGKDYYLFHDDEYGKIEEIDEDEDEVFIGCDTSEIGYISLPLRLKGDDLIDLIEYAVKKLNKLKTVLEGLK